MNICWPNLTITPCKTPKQRNMTHQKFVVDCFDDYFLRCVLTDIKPQLEHLVVAGVLDERGVEAFQPRAGTTARGITGAGGQRVGCRAEIENKENLVTLKEKGGDVG